MFKVMIVAAMGLGALYMIHLLAQDFNRIRRPIPPAATRILTDVLSGASSTLMRGKREVFANIKTKRRIVNLQNERQQQQQQKKYQNDNLYTNNTSKLAIDWKGILSRDPFECLQSLICQIMSGAEGKTEEAIILMDFLETTLSMAPAKIGNAFSRGLALRGSTELCYNEYPFCMYSAKTMLRVLKWFSDFNIME